MVAEYEWKPGTDELTNARYEAWRLECGLLGAAAGSVSSAKG